MPPKSTERVRDESPSEDEVDFVPVIAFSARAPAAPAPPHFAATAADVPAPTTAPTPAIPPLLYPTNVPPGPRRLNINRRLGYSPGNVTQPFQLPRNDNERDHRIEALRNQLRHPYAILDATLQWHLMREGWDVNRAAESFRDTNSGNGLPPIHPPLRLRGGRTLEASRHLTVSDTANYLRRSDRERAEDARRRGDDAPTPRAPSNSNIVQLLHRSGWNIDRTENEINTLDGRYEEVAAEMAGMRSVPTTLAEQDERLAWFISVTSVESWYSARVFLESFGWDIAHAVDEWLRRGDVPVVAVPTRRLKGGQSVPIYDNDGMREVSVNQPEIMRASGRLSTNPRYSTPTPVTSGFTASWAFSNPSTTFLRGYETTDNTRRFFVINEDKNPARVNCPDASKLHIEYILDSKYKVQSFQGKSKVNGTDMPFRWDDDDQADHSGSTEFDWSNPQHINRLNRWREEYFRRGTGELVRQHMMPFSKHELDWLREQEAIRHEEHFYRLAGQNPNDRQPTDSVKWARAVSAFAPGTHQLPVDMSGPELDDLYNRFTQTFQGHRFYTKIKNLGKGPPEQILKKFDVPRPYRSKHAIQTQKTRFPTLCRHFMRRLNNPHGGNGDADDMKSEPDSDFERDRNFIGPLPMPMNDPTGRDGSDQLEDRNGDHDEDRLENQNEDNDNPMFFTEADGEADTADVDDTQDGAQHDARDGSRDNTQDDAGAGGSVKQEDGENQDADEELYAENDAGNDAEDNTRNDNVTDPTTKQEVENTTDQESDALQDPPSTTPVEPPQPSAVSSIAARNMAFFAPDSDDEHTYQPLMPPVPPRAFQNVYQNFYHAATGTSARRSRGAVRGDDEEEEEEEEEHRDRDEQSRDGRDSDGQNSENQELDDPETDDQENHNDYDDGSDGGSEDETPRPKRRRWESDDADDDDDDDDDDGDSDYEEDEDQNEDSDEDE